MIFVPKCVCSAFARKNSKIRAPELKFSSLLSREFRVHVPELNFCAEIHNARSNPGKIQIWNKAVAEFQKKIEKICEFERLR